MTYALTVERVFEASAEDVFDAFTDTDAQREWMSYPADPGSILETECDLRVGGEWVAAWGENRAELYRETNIFQVVDRPRRLVMATTTTSPDGQCLETTTEISFDEHDGKTRMTVVQSGFPTAEVRDYFRTTAWAGALDALDAYVRSSRTGRFANTSEKEFHRSEEGSR
jgi:uncharacterized protein YndB with AHSA1/START domain